jgi:hypothetical protein
MIPSEWGETGLLYVEKWANHKGVVAKGNTPRFSRSTRICESQISINK